MSQKSEAKQAYETPKLMEFGGVDELTKSITQGSGAGDGQGQQKTGL